MIKAPVFDKTIASTYDKTRPITAEVCRATFAAALSGVQRKRRACVLDLGCGTGRILQFLVPESLKPDKVVGIDNSPVMLAEARKKPSLRGVGLLRQSLFDFEASSDNRKRFDVVICHWLLHCVPAWQAAVLACLRLLKSDGVLAWLDEDGDLYRALDQLDPRTHDSNAEAVYELFNAYYREIARVRGRTKESLPDPQLRAGTALRNTQALRDFLPNCGWNVVNGQDEQTWTMDVTVSWVFNNVVVPRVFTNLRSIPLGIHHRAIKNLKNEFGHRGFPELDRGIKLRFWARGYHAEQSRSRLDSQAACRAVYKVAQKIEPFLLKHSGIDAGKGRAGNNMILLLQQFFISLFERLPSNLWKSFWEFQSVHTKQRLGLPVWVWVRLSTHRSESFKEFLRSSIYKVGRSPDVLDRKVVELYFGTKNPFLSLVRKGSVKLAAVALCMVSDSSENGWGVVRRQIHNGSRECVFIQVPRSFFEDYCPRSFDFTPFSARKWKADALRHQKELLKRQMDADRQRTRKALLTLGSALDREITQNRFRGEGGLESLLELLQGVALFRGSAFYIFAVPGPGDEVGGSITVGCDEPLSDLQTLTLQEIAEALLLLPAIRG